MSSRAQATPELQRACKHTPRGVAGTSPPLRCGIDTRPPEGVAAQALTAKRTLEHHDSKHKRADAGARHRSVSGLQSHAHAPTQARAQARSHTCKPQAHMTATHRACHRHGIETSPPLGRGIGEHTGIEQLEHWVGDTARKLGPAQRDRH